MYHIYIYIYIYIYIRFLGVGIGIGLGMGGPALGAADAPRCAGLLGGDVDLYMYTCVCIHTCIHVLQYSIL